MEKNKIIGVTGKGGCGKTAFVSLAIKLLAGKGAILAIDGDPAGGLPYTLGVTVDKTVGDIRHAMIDDPRVKKEAEDKHIREVISGALTEGKGFKLLSIGRAEGPGCYCLINDFLRYGIDSVVEAFDVIFIDCEAGPEQISRRIVQRTDVLAIIADNSMRSIQAARVISKVAYEVAGKEFDTMGLVINRYAEKNEPIKEAAEQLGLQIFGYIPEDENIDRYDLSGRPLLELPDSSPSIVAVQGILTKMGLMDSN